MPTDSLPYPQQPRTIEEMSRYLNLPQTADQYASLLDSAAKENLSHETFLLRLLSHECSAKFERIVKSRIAYARIPAVKTLESFDFNHPSFIPKAKVLAAFDLGFISRKEGIIFIGPSGVGKSHLAQALAHKTASTGIRTLFTRAVDMLNHLIASQADHTLHKAIRNYTAPALLVIDEVGHLPFDQKGGEHFFNVISRRYELGSVVLTTNRPFKDWGKIFHDNTLASGIIDRLVHHSDVIKIEGASYRVKDRKAKA